MAFTLDASLAESLISFVGRRVQRDGCDHTHRFTAEWARRESVDWHDLQDVLDANGGFCDCEVALNLPVGIDLQAPDATNSGQPDNPWLLPPGFACKSTDSFTRLIVCQANLGEHTYALDGETLVPAPMGAKPRGRVRKLFNFFIGCPSGLPAEVGVIRDCSRITADEFARRVANSGPAELASFSYREGAFVLSRIAGLQPSMTVATDYADRIGVSSRHKELTVHRVMLRR